MAGSSAADPILMPSTAAGATELPIDALGGAPGWLMWHAPTTGSVKLELGNTDHPLVNVYALWWVLDHAPVDEADVTSNGLQEINSTDHDGDGISYSGADNAHGNGVFPVFAGAYYVAKIFFTADPTVVPVRWVTRTSSTAGPWLAVPPQDFTMPGAIGKAARVQNNHMTPFFDGDGTYDLGADNGNRTYGDGPTMIAETYAGHGYYQAEAHIDATSVSTASDIGSSGQPDLGFQGFDYHLGVNNVWNVSLGEHHYDFGGSGGPYGYLASTVSFVGFRANGVPAGSLAPVDAWHRTALTYEEVFRGSVEMESGPQGLTPSPTSTLAVSIDSDSGTYSEDSMLVITEDTGLADTIHILDASTAFPSLITTGPTVTQWLTPSDLSTLPVLGTFPLDHLGSGPLVDLTTTKALTAGQASVIAIVTGRHLNGTALPTMDRFDGSQGGTLSASLGINSVTQKLRRTWPRIRLLTFTDVDLPSWTPTAHPALRQLQRGDGLTGRGPRQWALPTFGVRQGPGAIR